MTVKLMSLYVRALNVREPTKKDSHYRASPYGSPNWAFVAEGNYEPMTRAYRECDIGR